jgi:hypothetical protein
MICTRRSTLNVDEDDAASISELELYDLGPLLKNVVHAYLFWDLSFVLWRVYGHCPLLALDVPM